MSGSESNLERLTGIGTARANDLREAGIETYADIRAASMERLTAVEGISQRLAERLKAEIGREDGEEPTIPGVTSGRIADIRDRFKHFPWERWYWRRDPAEVSILIYCEGSIKIATGGFDGLTHVISTLNSDPWFWVTFDVTTAHRSSDPDADMQNVGLDDVSLEEYDELWLFGIGGLRPENVDPDDTSDVRLGSSEVSAVESFMNDGGGVLTTGDHNDLGEGITKQIPRVGKMRKYDKWHDTITSGGNETDDVPQQIRIREYPLYSFHPFGRSTAPHPVLCGPEGPIKILPDHPHEGAVNVPSNYPTSEWPEKGGHQPTVEPIAWAQGSPPGGGTTEFPVIGVYNGHRAEVGRIAADATWHHWFDYNLHGGGSGFDDTPQGRKHLEKFEAYFLNLAVWLAPPSRQTAMWNALLWGGLWKGPIVMFDPSIAAGWRFGATARDALGQFAPQCQIDYWCHDFMPIEVVELLDEFREIQVRPDEPAETPGPIPVPAEEFVIGETVRTLLEEYGTEPDIVEYPGDDVLAEAVEAGTDRGLERLVEYHESVARRGEGLAELLG